MLTETIIDFVESVGIKVFKMPIDGDTFLPGLQLKDGALIVDTEKLLYPGDILHEAGHLATMPPAIRETMNDNLPPTQENQGGEMMALAWSYAAARYLNINPHIVFHADGYKGGGENLVQNFTEGRCVGLPLLQWAGMAYDEQKAKEFNKPPFPYMINWLREN
ncbi:hypothetical protein JN11_04115 [Mucilaginibacter frigoritolerans]|uniref:Uncharacterized protein n=1 Tax=Mucilaginibacter frigoritolerans TaxID=652788 RepID=A0A562TS09_9SPHI|nr:hypothetical protein [Mucilaginibacter frigoritolerans]TWI96381.1 hypothetical protein JN11_04115 [Mucilaginibacter frigoritolerans]